VQQEMLVLLAAILVHPTARVPMPLIPQVERVMFGIVGQFVPNYR
jgi:hypothetical protein